ncbi:hypothetical protein [Geotoga petraea]|uniref:Uncharacterized protein n=1 Tax=Geotoga petraea TaxID=28234 RepID=A0A1G6NU97_9BACT|nr:hypothetical protein [Geotoga petraea]SDC71389.1 hypothetical protein SAMN04488588_1663 [Geotoga petraea]
MKKVILIVAIMVISISIFSIDKSYEPTPAPNAAAVLRVWEENTIVSQETKHKDVYFSVTGRISVNLGFIVIELEAEAGTTKTIYYEVTEWHRETFREVWIAGNIDDDIIDPTNPRTVIEKIGDDYYTTRKIK